MVALTVQTTATRLSFPNLKQVTGDGIQETGMQKKKKQQQQQHTHTHTHTQETEYKKQGVRCKALEQKIKDIKKTGKHEKWYKNTTNKMPET